MPPVELACFAGNVYVRVVRFGNDTSSTRDQYFIVREAIYSDSFRMFLVSARAHRCPTPEALGIWIRAKFQAVDLASPFALKLFEANTLSLRCRWPIRSK